MFKVCKNPFLPVTLSLYLNFFALGIGLIAIAQHMDYFIDRFHTDEAGVAFIIAGMGIGRLAVYYFTGWLSDRFGRRLCVCAGNLCYILFFTGIFFSPDMKTAFLFAIVAGIGNAAADTGTYPALMEAWPGHTGSAVILCKAAISLGQMLYPLLLGYLLTNRLWRGWGFMIPAALFAVLLFIISRMRFPDESWQEKENSLKHSKKPSMWLEGTATVIFGTAVYAVFYTFVIWIPKYAAVYGKMEEAASLRTVTWYSAGSLICVLLLAVLLSKYLRPVVFIVIFPAVSAAAAFLIFLYPVPALCNAGAFIMGFTAAGGVLQLGVSVLSEFFPTGKAKMTAVYMFFGTIANLGVPLVTGIISKSDIRYIMLFDASVAVVAFVMGIIIFVRYHSIFVQKK